MKLQHILYGGLIAMVALACENDTYLYQDVDRLWLSGDEAQQATEDSLFYSFRLYDYSVTEADLNLVVHLTGKTSGRERKFKLEVVDTATNVPVDAYRIGDLVMPEKAFTATVPITVKRSVDGIDLTKDNARLTLRVVSSDEFEVGVEDAVTYTLVWCDYLVKPESWSNINYYIGPFSQARFKFIIDFTGYTDFTEFSGNYNKILWLQGILNKYLDEYNADPANADRPEGWPYKNDDGNPLKFGQGLKA